MSEDLYRILGIDYGSVRIGLALSDPLRIIAKGLKTIPNDDNSIREILRIVAAQEVRAIIVGYPLNLNGEEGNTAGAVNEFIKRLQESTAVPVERYDERFTSIIAEKAIRQMGTPKKKRRDKSAIDEVASAVLLQGYLDAARRGR